MLNENTNSPNPPQLTSAQLKAKGISITDEDLIELLERYSIEDVIELKVALFLEKLGGFEPDNLYKLILTQMERPLIKQALRRAGNNQVHAARILGINRNTLRKKIQTLGIQP